MGRFVSGNMTTILAGDHTIDSTITITFPDASEMKFATAPLSIAKGDFTNDIEGVREIRQTLEAAVDVVNVALQNKDRVLSIHLAANWQKWRKAEAVIGRYYTGGANFGTTEWVEMFRGSVQQPNADDLQVTFDVIHDTLSPGQIICNATLDPMCPNVFKDAKTCAYVGVETLCDHHLKSTGGCDGRSNAHHFRGMEHRYNPDLSVPGTGGNPDDPPGGGSGPCPRIDQFVRVEGIDGKPSPLMVGFLTEEHYLWHPIKRRFFKVRKVTLVKDQPIWEIIANNGGVGFSSFPHPVIAAADDHQGRAVSQLRFKDDVLTEISGELVDGGIIYSSDTGETGDVVKIEIEAEEEEDKIYVYGDSPDKMVVCHNSKPVEIPL